MEQMIRSLDEIIDNLHSWSSQMEAVIHAVEEGSPEPKKPSSKTEGREGGK